MTDVCTCQTCGQPVRASEDVTVTPRDRLAALLGDAGKEFSMRRTDYDAKWTTWTADYLIAAGVTLSITRLYDALWLLKARRAGANAEFPTLPEVRDAIEVASTATTPSQSMDVCPKCGITRRQLVEACREHFVTFAPAPPALDVALRNEITELERSGGMHDYTPGFHRAHGCLACEMLSRLRAALASQAPEGKRP